MFKHFLITRFNLKKSDWKTNKNNVAVLTDEWHENRFELFTQFCFPSVLSQKNKNFEWLVFFDTTTPEKYKHIIAELETKTTNFKPFFIDGMDSFLPSIKSYISNYKEDFIITSRLDNDDCLSEFYIEETQKTFKKQDFCAIDFVNGYTIQIHPEIKIGYRLHDNNPFISLIEKNHEPKTVWSMKHSHWKKEKNVLQLKTLPLWGSIIHQENKVNEFYGFGNVSLEDMFKRLKIDPEQEQHILKHIIPNNKWKLESYSNFVLSYLNFYFRKAKKSIGVYSLKS